VDLILAREEKKKDTKEVVHVFHESRDLHRSKAKQNKEGGSAARVRQGYLKRLA